MVKKKTSRSRFFKLSRLLVPALIIGAAVIAGLELTNTTFLFHKRPSSSTISSSGIIHQLPEQPATSNGRTGPQSSSSFTQGTATNNQNATSSTTSSSSPSQWTVSKSGVITVKEPTADSTVKTGFTLAGTATINKIQYRLIDDTAGVISQGFITVNDGAFSVSVSFRAYSNSGRLDVFNTDPNTGAEQNEVQIPINF